MNVWNSTMFGTYSASSTYKAQLGALNVFILKPAIWANWAPSKHKFFSWLILHDRVWTTDCLQRRGSPNCGLCQLCKQEPKYVAYMLFQIQICQPYLGAGQVLARDGGFAHGRLRQLPSHHGLVVLDDQCQWPKWHWQHKKRDLLLSPCLFRGRFGTSAMREFLGMSPLCRVSLLVRLEEEAQFVDASGR